MIMYIIILVQAEITDEVLDLVENETEVVTFHCEATGDPVPTIQWYFNDEMIHVSDASYNVSESLNGTVIESLLSIENIQSFDVGTYTCHAENFIGIDRSSGILTVNSEFVLPYINVGCCY